MSLTSLRTFPTRDGSKKVKAEQGQGLAPHNHLMLGDLIEFDKTETIFTNPANKLTEDYITGRFG